MLTADKDLIKNNLYKFVALDYKDSEVPGNGNYNSIQDFKTLCKLDLRSKSTVGEHIDLMRALTDGEIKNAYFIDEGGRKFCVHIHLEEHND